MDTLIHFMDTGTPSGSGKQLRPLQCAQVGADRQHGRKYTFRIGTGSGTLQRCRGDRWKAVVNHLHPRYTHHTPEPASSGELIGSMEGSTPSRSAALPVILPLERCSQAHRATHGHADPLRGRRAPSGSEGSSGRLQRAQVGADRQHGRKYTFRIRNRLRDAAALSGGR